MADAIACGSVMDLGSLKAIEKQIVQLLAARQEDMMAAMRVQKDEQARRSATRLDSEHQAARVHDFGLFVGGEASLQNNDGGHVKVKIVSMDKEGNSASDSVTLASNGSQKKVQVIRLRPLVAQKCERLGWCEIEYLVGVVRTTKIRHARTNRKQLGTFINRGIGHRLSRKQVHRFWPQCPDSTVSYRSLSWDDKWTWKHPDFYTFFVSYRRLNGNCCSCRAGFSIFTSCWFSCVGTIIDQIKNPKVLGHLVHVI